MFRGDRRMLAPAQLRVVEPYFCGRRPCFVTNAIRTVCRGRPALLDRIDAANKAVAKPMRILLTLPSPLFPADTGGKIRSLNILSRLSKTVEIHAVSFVDLSTKTAVISEMKDMFASYTPLFRREARKYSAQFYMEVLANQFSSWPYFLSKDNRSRFRSAVNDLASRRSFDLLLCDFLHTAGPLHDFIFKPKVVFEHNVEFLLRKRKWQTEERSLHRVVFDREWRKTRAVEARVCRSFDHVITVSDDDQRILQDEFAIQRTSVIPTGVDTDFFRPARSHPQPGHMVFVGSMDWDPNEDAMVSFLREAYPIIRRAMPHASLAIVGRAPSSRLCRIASQENGVEITGWVPDVRPALARAEVVIVPLRVGGGTRIKIPEAMAMAKPVVSTPIGAEGLPFQDGCELSIAKPENFAHAVLELMDCPARRTSIGAAARKVVASKFSWENVAGKFEEILEWVAWSAKHERTVLGSKCGFRVSA
jgi:glycosyltransferase involved in cell wall biosynthesis